MKRLFFMQALLCHMVTGIAQAPVTPRPLSIGDTLPVTIIKSIINYPDSVIDLAAKKPKLIILDFWSANCASCYYTLAKLDSIQQQFPEVLIITVTQKDSDSLIRTLLQKIPVTRNVKLPVVLYDSILREYFPHQLISHMVWMDGNRKFIAATGGDYVNSSKIREALTGRALAWPVKDDLMEFDYNKPLLVLNRESGITTSSLFFSAFTGYIDGIAPPNGIRIDSINNCKRFCLYNQSLQEFAKTASHLRIKKYGIKYRFRLHNKERFECPPQTLLSDWQRANTYCYSLSVPLNTSDSTLLEMVGLDLERWLSLLHVKIKLLSANPPLYEIVETTFSP